MPSTNFYTARVLDRVSHLRDDAGWLAARLCHESSRLLPVWRERNLVSGIDDTPQYAHLPIHLVGALRADHAEPVLLGLIDDVAYFTLDVSHIEEPQAHELLGDAGLFEDLRRVGPLLPSEQGNLLAFARGINYWHSRHRHCGVCGAPTVSEKAGHQRRCTSSECGAISFPRTDAAIITLVYDAADRILLARSPRFVNGMQSVLAGFLEPGESLEDTVAREIHEEVGIHVADIEYQHSQPWPFPSSLMVGFRARALDTDIRIDNEEILEAGWYGRSFLKTLTPESPLKLPRPDSIARRLIEEWLAEN
jgi:NAD+ diphosphatase